jgi:cytochrome c
MNLLFKATVVLNFISILAFSQEVNGEKIFKDYCWGCHHQTSIAFGPSFQEIADKRNIGEIQGHIISPKTMYKQLGHKRSVMPSFQNVLSQEQLDSITNFIISYKSKKD